MRVAVFIICLFYLLLGGYNYAYTGALHHSYSSAWHIKKNHAKFTNKNQSYPVVKETSPAGGDLFYMASVIEDEDTNNESARKYKLRSFYADPHTVILTYLYSSYKAPQSIQRFLSNKYIALRI